MKKFIILLVVAIACSMVISVSAQATLLQGSLTADDYFEAYISQSDSTQGTLIGYGLPDTSPSGPDGYGWNMVFSIKPTSISVPPTDWYLHIKAWDGFKVIAGFKGAFTLSDTAFQFSNGKQSLLTNVSSDWAVGTNWGLHDGTVTSASHPSWPLPVAGQSWIWTNNGAYTDSPRYFSTKITAVPEPATLLAAFSILGPAAVMFRRRRS